MVSQNSMDVIALIFLFLLFYVAHNLPIIRRAAVKCDVGGPAKPVAPSAAPPNAHATPPWIHVQKNC